MQVLSYPLFIILRRTCLSVNTSNAEVASSSKSIGDFLKSALAMEIRCACPSENPPPLSPTLEFMPFGSFFTKSYAQAVFKAYIISSSVAFGFTMRILSAIVPEKIVFPCGT